MISLRISGEKMNGANQVLSGGRLWLSSSDRKTELKAEFERVAVPQLSHLYTSAFYLTMDKTESEDLVQETYLRAFRFFDKFQSGTNCKAWLLSILRNLFVTWYQQKKREPEIVDWQRIDQVYDSMVEEGAKGGGGNLENFLVSQLMDDEVKKALRELPEEFRAAIVLVGIEELTYEQAAKVMECPIGTVRSRVSRGRRMLQVALRGLI